ncbi:MAG: hypothetical protein K2W96_02530 [Gemmataceae bacterium]|nr:hypothetical protein [Gemmataceae bacterium]
MAVRGIHQRHRLVAGRQEDRLIAAREQTLEELPARIRADQGEQAERRAPRVASILRRIGTPEALVLLKKLAAGDPASRCTRAAK